MYNRKQPSSNDTVNNAHRPDLTNNLMSATSFTSPYKAHTLDQIPTPILKFLSVLGPTIHLAAQFLQILLWKSSNPRESFLLVLVYVCLCLWARPVIMFGLPCSILYKLAKDWISMKTNQRRRETLEKKRQQERMKRYQMLKEEEQGVSSEEEEEDDRLQQLKKQQQKEEEEEMYISRKIRPQGQISLDDTIQDIQRLNELLDDIKSAFLEQQSWIVHHLDGTRSEMIVSTLTVWMYVTPIWILMCWLWGTQVMLAVLGSLILISPAPWFKLMVMTLRKNILLRHGLAALYAYGVACVLTTARYCPYVPSIYVKGQQQQQQKPTLWGKLKLGISGFRNKSELERARALKIMERLDEQIQEQQKKKTSSDGSSSSSRRDEITFQFEIFENQRWWLGVNWTTNMMPSERAPWTDNELKPISAKEKFKLPESTVKSVKQYDADRNREIKKTVNKVWQWVDGDWWVDMTGELDNKVDQNGWEYGNNAWKQMSGSPGLQTFTRRRRWCRRAKLVEKEIIEEAAAAVIDSNNSNKKTV